MSRPHPYLTELKSLLRLAAPLAAVHAGNQLMSFVDVAVVGRLGAASLAGIGLANGIFFTLSLLGMGAMMGFDPMVSQALGAGDRARARRYLWQGVWLALAVTLILAIPISVAPYFLVPFGIEEAAANEARIYLHIRLIGLYPMLVFMAVRAYLQAKGVVRPMVISMVAANVVNVVADVLLVYGGGVLPAWAGPLRAIPGYGVAGAAAATVLCTVFQLAIVAWALRSIHVGTFTHEMRRPHRQDLRQAVRVGLPIGLQMASETSVFALVGLLIGRMGTQHLAAHQIALTLASLTFTAAVGIGAAASVRVGRSIGAGDTAGTRRAGITAIAAGGAWMGLFGLLFLLVPGHLAALLTDQAGVIQAAIPLLMIAAVFQIFDGLQAVGSGALRGAGDTRYPFVVNVLGYYAIALPVGLWLASGRGLQAVGLWWGLCIGLILIAFALVGRFLRISSKVIKPLTAPATGPPQAIKRSA